MDTYTNPPHTLRPPKATAITERSQHNRHWSPRNEAVTSQEATHFAWKQETGSIQSYQHLETGRHIQLCGSAGFAARSHDGSGLENRPIEEM